MPLSSITIPPAPEHVRAVRMVAGAAARRGRVPDHLIDEVRLAVGEAVARVVLRHTRSGRDDDIEVRLRDDPEAFEVEILDHSPVDLSDDDDGLSLALTQSLAPQSSLLPNARGEQVVRLVWPLDD